MFQGTASDVGKSTIVLSTLKILKDRGVNAAPFKAQNMALNSYAAIGGEIGRAQAIQAEAAGIFPSVEMNPILLKPNGDGKSHVIVKGKFYRSMTAKQYYEKTDTLWKSVIDSYKKLEKQFDVIIIEGAGSPAEFNLKDKEIANMKIAHFAKSKVILVADIDRGGVFASIVGTLNLLDKKDKALIKGIIINKFRGDVSLLDQASDFLNKKAGKPLFGIMPYIDNLVLDQEDSMALENNRSNSFLDKKSGVKKINVAVVRLPLMSNFTDFESLKLEPDINLTFVASPESLDNAHLIIIPGSKNTMKDLIYLHENGFSKKLAKIAPSKTVIGICGGLQCLGKFIEDKKQSNPSLKKIKGIGLLPITTFMDDRKITDRVKARTTAPILQLSDKITVGYEIHFGKTKPLEKTTPLFKIIERNGRETEENDGFVSKDKNVFGTYIHGLFDSKEFKRAFLNLVRVKNNLTPIDGGVDYFKFKQKQIQRVAKVFEENVAVDSILEFIGVK